MCRLTTTQMRPLLILSALLQKLTRVWGSLPVLKPEMVLKSGRPVTERPQQCDPHILASFRGGGVRPGALCWVSFAI